MVQVSRPVKVPDCQYQNVSFLVEYGCGSICICRQGSRQTYVDKASGQTYVDKASGQTYVDKASGQTYVDKASGQTYVDKAYGQTYVPLICSGTYIPLKASGQTSDTDYKTKSRTFLKIITLY